MLNVRSDGKIEVVNGNNRLVCLLLSNPKAKIKDIDPKDIQLICEDNDKLAEMTVPPVVDETIIGDDFLRIGLDDRGKLAAYVKPQLHFDDKRLPEKIRGRPLRDTVVELLKLKNNTHKHN